MIRRMTVSENDRPVMGNTAKDRKIIGRIGLFERPALPIGTAKGAAQW